MAPTDPNEPGGDEIPAGDVGARSVGDECRPGRHWLRTAAWAAVAMLCVGGAAGLLWVRQRAQDGAAQPLPGQASPQQLALARAERDVELNPNDFGARMRLGLLRYQAGDMNAAVEQFGAATRVLPEHAEAQLYLGYAHAQRGDAIEAEEAFRRVIALNPTVPEAYVGAASARYVQAYGDDAMAVLAQAAKACPDTLNTHLRLAEAYYLCNQPTEAEQQYREALRLAPDNAYAHYGLGRNLFDIAKLAEARAELAKAIALGMEAPVVHYYAGLAFLHGEATDENQRRAREHFEQALRLDPTLARAHDCLGQLALREGDPERARERYEQAVTLAPDLADAHHGLSVVYRRLGREEDAARARSRFKELSDREHALERLHRTVVDQPKDPAARLALGRFYLEQGNLVGATRQLQVATALAPGDAESHRLLQEVYTLTGRPTDARRQAEVLARLEGGA